MKFDNESTKNIGLDNSSKLKESKVFSKVILSLDLSNEKREDCKKLLPDKLKGSNEWVARIRGQPGAFHDIAYRRRVVELN